MKLLTKSLASMAAARVLGALVTTGWLVQLLGRLRDGAAWTLTDQPCVPVAEGDTFAACLTLGSFRTRLRFGPMMEEQDVHLSNWGPQRLRDPPWTPVSGTASALPSCPLGAEVGWTASGKDCECLLGAARLRFLGLERDDWTLAFDDELLDLWRFRSARLLIVLLCGTASPWLLVPGTAMPSLLVPGTATPWLLVPGTASPWLLVPGTATPWLVADARDGNALFAGARDGNALFAGARDGITLAAGARDGNALVAGARDGNALVAGARDGILDAGWCGQALRLHVLGRRADHSVACRWW